MPFYLGALRMLNIATGYSKNTLSCSELNEEHAGEGFRSLRHILTPLWACKAKKCHFSRKFDLWPDLTRSNIDLGPKTICAIARSRRGASTGLFREALRPSGADRQGGGRTNPPPPDRPRYEKCPDRARVMIFFHHLNIKTFPQIQQHRRDISPRSLADRIWSDMDISAVSVEWRGRKPCWVGERRWFWAR